MPFFEEQSGVRIYHNAKVWIPQPVIISLVEQGLPTRKLAQADFLFSYCTGIAFFTTGRQDPPLAKTWLLFFWRHSLYCSGLEPKLQYLRSACINTRSITYKTISVIPKKAKTYKPPEIDEQKTMSTQWCTQPRNRKKGVGDRPTRQRKMQRSVIRTAQSYFCFKV